MVFDGFCPFIAATNISSCDRVFLAARRQNELDAAVNECNALKEGSAGGLATDVSIRADNRALIDAAVARFGRIDVLVLNAGISAGAPFDQVNEEGLNSFENVTKTNYFGPVYAAHYALPQLLQHQGRVVVISSVFGLSGGPTRTFYAGSKFALHGFFESLRMELAQHNVTVTLVCPGPVATDIARSRVGPDGKRATVGHFDMKQAITPELAAEYIVDATQRGERLRTFSLQSSLLLKLKNLAPALCDFLVVRSMKKLGMLETETKE